jgi:hypothetical protein
MPSSGRRSRPSTCWALVALATATLSACHSTSVLNGIPWHIEPGGEAQRSGALHRRCGAVLVTAHGNVASGLGAPGDSDTRFPGEKTDLRLDPASRAVDAGVVLPNFNDRFSGQGTQSRLLRARTAAAPLRPAA